MLKKKKNKKIEGERKRKKMRGGKLSVWYGIFYFYMQNVCFISRGDLVIWLMHKLFIWIVARWGALFIHLYKHICATHLSHQMTYPFAYLFDFYTVLWQLCNNDQSFRLKCEYIKCCIPIHHNSLLLKQTYVTVQCVLVRCASGSYNECRNDLMT